MTDRPPSLRSVPDSGDLPGPGPGPAPPARVPEGVHRWIPLALAVALVVCLALLVWSRSELGNQIVQLQESNAALSATLVERNRVISLHEGRIDDIRAGLDGLRDLVDRPLQ